MNKIKALELLKNHTQYFVPSEDLDALEIAIIALRNEIKRERKSEQKALNIVKRDLIKSKGEYLAKEITIESLEIDFPTV